MVVMLVGPNLYKVSLELSNCPIVFGGGIKSNVVFVQNWCVDDIGSGLKGSDFFLEFFYFFVLSSLPIDECLESSDFSDQLLELLGIYFVVVIDVV